MIPSKSAIRRFSTRLSLSMVLAFYPGGPTKVVGQSIEPPPGQGSPNGTVGGGSRTSSSFCTQSPQITKRLMTLSPTQAVANISIERPDLWSYLSRTMAQRVELSLFNNDMNGIDQATLPISKKASLMSLRLPAEASKLKKNQPYHRAATLVCNQSDRTANWVVSDWIQRTELELAKEKLASAEVGDPLWVTRSASLYVAQGRWNEAFSALTEPQPIKPDDSYFRNAWAKLLKSLKLEKVVTEAIAPPNR